MSEGSSGALRLSRLLLKLLIVLNVAVGGLAFAALVASYVAEGLFADYYATLSPDVDVPLLAPTMRAMLLIGAPMFALIHVLLSRILEIVESVALGQAFVVENAVRLRTVGWCLLMLQVLNLAFGVAVRVVETANVAMDWDLSLAGWLAVLLAFVLARVFEEGARMRDDLQAMI